MPSESVESKVRKLEERVGAIEQLPARIDGLEVQILQLREELHVEFSAVRRETRVLHEDTVARIAVIGVGLETLSQRVDGLDTSLSQRIDRTETKLSQRIDRTDAKLDLILARLDSQVPKRKHKRG